MNTILAVIGIIGGLLCAVADLLLDLKGPQNKKLGKMGIIDSEWENMAHWRFVWSAILAMFAVPMYSCGFIAVMMTLHKGHPVIAIVLIIAGIIHAPLWCVILNPVVFQLVGFLFRATKLDIFIDAPSCCAASLGLASYGLLALLCL